MHRRILVGLLVIGALLRAAYLFEYSALPFAEGPLGDSVVYLHQAERIAAGDHGDSSLLAMSPGYGYVLALLGAQPWTAIVLQTLAGLLCATLVARLARQTGGDTYGDAAAIVATLLYLGYGLVPFYESKLLSDSLGVSLALSVAAMLATDGTRVGRPAPTLGAGALMGVAVLVRAHLVFVALLLPPAALLPWTRGERWRPRLRRAAALAAGLGAVLLARGLFTLWVAGVFVPVLYTAPEAHVVHASSAASAGTRLGDLGLQTEGPPAAWDVVRRVDAHRRASALDATSTVTDDSPERRAASGRRAPGPDLLGTALSIDLHGLLRSAPGKIAATFRHDEATHQYAYYGERDHIRALDVHWVSFGAIAWLALIGAVVALVRREGRTPWAHLPWVLGVLAVCVLYLPSARYRLPMLVGLLPLAGLGGAAVAKTVTARASKPRGLRWVAAVLAVPPTAWIVWSGAVANVSYVPRHPERWELVMAESLLGQPHDPAVVDALLERARALAAARHGGTPDPTVEAHVEALRAWRGPRH